MDPISDSEVFPGDVLAGKFRIERILGRGGMGVVVAATHLQLDEKVALKFLLPEALKHPEAVARFEREARAAVKIKSEHVARVTDVGTMESGSPYMVMEFLNGVDLGQYLEQRGPLPIDEAVHYILQASEAIAEAHSLGIVHRDLKPANLFRIIRADGTPSIKVLDFGISKVTTGNEASMTQTSSMMGSPYYMSPEQMTSSKNVDHRTDVWALGVILHELLTGKVPYEGETIPEVCAKVLQVAPPDLKDFRKDAPWELQTVITRALAKKRDDRYQNVAEFSHALVAYGTSEAVRSVDRISRVLGVAQSYDLPSRDKLSDSSADLNAKNSDALEATTLGGSANTQLDYVPPTHKRSLLPVFAAVAIVLGGLGAWWMLGSSRSATEPAAELVPDQVETSTPETSTPEASTPETTLPASELAKSPQQELKKEPELPAQAELPAKEPEATKAALTPPKSAPTPVVRPSPAVRPSPRPTTAPAPSPAPAPTPAPAPKPKNSSSLYLDRK